MIVTHNNVNNTKRKKEQILSQESSPWKIKSRNYFL
jgi:hypothetical protein